MGEREEAWVIRWRWLQAATQFYAGMGTGSILLFFYNTHSMWSVLTYVQVVLKLIKLKKIASQCALFRYFVQVGMWHKSCNEEDSSGKEGFCLLWFRRKCFKGIWMTDKCLINWIQLPTMSLISCLATALFPRNSERNSFVSERNLDLGFPHPSLHTFWSLTTIESLAVKDQWNLIRIAKCHQAFWIQLSCGMCSGIGSPWTLYHTETKCAASQNISETYHSAHCVHMCLWASCSGTRSTSIVGVGSGGEGS